MKILRYSTQVSEPQPVAPAAAVPAVLPDVEATQRAEERAQVGTLREELERLNAAHAQAQEQLQQNARAMQALTEEIASLKKSPKAPPAPASPSDTVPKPEPSREWLEPLAIDLPSEKNEGEVALLSKLWDYLNHVAVEIPLRKSDRNK